MTTTEEWIIACLKDSKMVSPEHYEEVIQNVTHMFLWTVLGKSGKEELTEVPPPVIKMEEACQKIGVSDDTENAMKTAMDVITDLKSDVCAYFSDKDFVNFIGTIMVLTSAGRLLSPFMCHLLPEARKMVEDETEGYNVGELFSMMEFATQRVDNAVELVASRISNSDECPKCPHNDSVLKRFAQISSEEEAEEFRNMLRKEIFSLSLQDAVLTLSIMWDQHYRVVSDRKLTLTRIKKMYDTLERILCGVCETAGAESPSEDSVPNELLN